jgi:hydroxyacylglutathione hydrolase
MRNAVLAACLAMTSIHVAAGSELDAKVWNHGSADCSTNRDPPIEVFRFDATTYILRQNKCLNFEAPFVYVLVGERQVFVQDTGATEDAATFPLYEVIRGQIAKTLPLLVTHSHSHSDHTAADAQFRGKPGVTLIEPDSKSVREFFGLAQWPQRTATLDLGGRSLVVIPIPGHQDESIAVYDSQTGWLLTGDTLYPGTLYVRDWQEYRTSIRRLAEFARNHRIAAVMGTHIEISSTGALFPIGSTFQPGEAPLPLSAADLFRLDEKLQQVGQPAVIALEKFTVAPISTLQRVISNVAKWFGIR